MEGIIISEIFLVKDPRYSENPAGRIFCVDSIKTIDLETFYGTINKNVPEYSIEERNVWDWAEKFFPVQVLSEELEQLFLRAHNAHEEQFESQYDFEFWQARL